MFDNHNPIIDDTISRSAMARLADQAAASRNILPGAGHFVQTEGGSSFAPPSEDVTLTENEIAFGSATSGITSSPDLRYDDNVFTQTILCPEESTTSFPAKLALVRSRGPLGDTDPVGEIVNGDILGEIDFGGVLSTDDPGTYSVLARDYVEYEGDGTTVLAKRVLKVGSIQLIVDNTGVMANTLSVSKFVATDSNNYLTSVTPPTIIGSRTDGTALASLLSALAALNLIVDSTTA